jgi:hypothetical protein
MNANAGIRALLQHVKHVAVAAVAVEQAVQPPMDVVPAEIARANLVGPKTRIQQRRGGFATAAL